jgi:hypothetical protein
MIQKQYLTILLFLVILLLSFACERIEEGDGVVQCSECYQEKPETGPFNAVVTINSENPFVPLVIYRGNVEDNNVEYVDTTWESSYWVEVPVNAYYSVAAEYKVGDKIIFAIDGDKLKTKYTENDCDEPCYYYKGGNVDVRLRE